MKEITKKFADFVGAMETGGLRAAIAAFAVLLPLTFSSSLRAQVSVYTRSYDNARTGANLQETTLTPANVNATNFGKLFTVPVDGHVYAQPLYVAGLTIAGGTHNVVFVASMRNTVYAIDADAGTILWQQNFGPPIVPEEVQIDQNISWATGLGILGTPVIDPATNYMYFLSGEEPPGTKNYSWNLNAIDITTGQPVHGSPVTITATYSTPDLTTPLKFDAGIHNPRPGLALANGNVYITFASHNDLYGYHGWVLAYSTSTLAQTAVYVDTTVGTKGGIWSAGQAPSVDSAGNIYISTGNGDFGATANKLVQTGNSFIKLSPSLELLDYFTPYNSANLNGGDQDLGSSGLLLVPGTNYAVGGGKQGVLYLTDTSNMGKFNASADQVKQEFQAVYGTGTSHIHSGPSYFNDAVNGPTIYAWGENDHLRAFTFNATTGMINTTPFAQSTMTAPATNNNGAMPGGFLAISANQNHDGILWASTPYNGDAAHQSIPGVLYAFDASTLKLLWTDKTNDARDEVGIFAKYVPPVVANGKMYIPNFGVDVKDGTGNLICYGLLNAAPTLTVAADDATRVYGADNPAFTGKVTGAQNGDTFSETFATTATATSAVGTYPITPTATGTDLDDYTVKTVNGTLTVTAAPTTTVLSAPPSATPGSNVTLTATVSSTAGTPGGTVTFLSGTTPIGTGTLDAGGNTTLSTTTLATGTDSLTAAYGASGNFAASTSTASSIVVSASSQTITFAPIPSQVYGSAPFVVSATSSLGSTYPVTLSLQSGPATLSGNTVTVTGVGTVVLLATQAGDAQHSAATATQSFAVTPAATTTTVSAPMNVTGGSSVTLTATVASSAGTPQGSVTFSAGTASLGSGNLAGGVATLATTALVVGSNTVTATYAAAGNFAGSSGTANIAIGAPIPADYALNANPTSLTVQAGKTASTMLTLSPSGGYNGSIALSCTNLPANATCKFDQDKVALSGDNKAASVGLTISTTAAQTSSLRTSPNAALLALAFWWPGALTGLAAVFRKRKAGMPSAVPLCLLLLSTFALAAALSGCGSGNGSSMTMNTSQVNVVASGTTASGSKTQTVVLSLSVTQ